MKHGGYEQGRGLEPVSHHRPAQFVAMGRLPFSLRLWHLRHGVFGGTS